MNKAYLMFHVNQGSQLTTAIRTVFPATRFNDKSYRNDFVPILFIGSLIFFFFFLNLKSPQQNSGLENMVRN